MNNRFKTIGLYILAAILLNGCQPKLDVPIHQDLNTGWQFKKVEDTIWYAAEVPGNVHSDLLGHQLIEDPFVGANENDIQWVSETDWEYKTSFNVSADILEKSNIELDFEGLDTYAEVYLNDSLILKTNNAFRSWQVDVKAALQLENTMKIKFESTNLHEEKEKEKLSYELPEGNRVFTRKAQFQYGWDWGPVINTSGIWRPVKIRAWDSFRFNDVDLNLETLNDSIASFTLHMDVDLDTQEELEYEIYVNDTLNTSYTSSNQLESKLEIMKPKLWWPHNIGDPYLYDVKVIAKSGRTILDTFQFKKGIRKVKLITEKDSLGSSFYFQVNGIPVYAKGANYIPQNSMQNKVSDQHYENLLNDVVDANMNMLRVWGGGIYEDDVFYELCDEKGIMIWQDFMFACAMYPGDEAFLKNVELEAVENVKRLNHHSSIVLWCGNNESSEGWHRWGWQANRSEEEKEEIWKNYLKVFDSILPKTVKQWSGNVPYWESSPSYGRGNPKYEFEGDAHDWWVWHDGYPFEHFEAHVPRFMSEFGFQSMPSYEAIKYINVNDSIDITSEGFKNHQKHVRGSELIHEYMARDYPVPTDAEDYIYMSQLTQARGITMGIEAHRRAKPYNMGSLYWQLNDCWPVVSWSSIDFLGNWKALHYKAKASFNDILISSEIKNNILKTYVINDKLESDEGILSIKVMDFKGSIVWEDSKYIEIDANSSAIKHELNLGAFQVNKDKFVVVFQFKDEMALYYLVSPRKLKLEQGDIQRKITKTDHGFSIELMSTTHQKDVFLYSDLQGHFTDNFFDLLPNKAKTIKFITNEALVINNDIKIKSFNNFIR